MPVASSSTAPPRSSTSIPPISSSQASSGRRRRTCSGKAAPAGFGAATIGVRPEHITVARDGEGWEGTVGVAEHLGSDTFVYVDVPQVGTLTARTIGEAGIRVGDRVRLKP